MFLVLQFLPLPEIAALDSKQGIALFWQWGAWEKERCLVRKQFRNPRSILHQDLKFCVACVTFQKLAPLISAFLKSALNFTEIACFVFSSWPLSTCLAGVMWYTDMCWTEPEGFSLVGHSHNSLTPSCSREGYLMSINWSKVQKCPGSASMQAALVPEAVVVPERQLVVVFRRRRECTIPQGSPLL